MILEEPRRGRSIVEAPVSGYRPSDRATSKRTLLYVFCIYH